MRAAAPIRQVLPSPFLSASLQFREIYVSLFKEVNLRRGHPHPDDADDEERFEVMGPSGMRFSIESTQNDFYFYVKAFTASRASAPALFGAEWHRISSSPHELSLKPNAFYHDKRLHDNLTRLSDAERAPSAHEAALTSIRAAVDIIKVNAKILREAPEDLVSAQAYEELRALQAFIETELRFDARRVAESDADDDDYQASIMDDDESDSDSVASLGSGDREISEQVIGPGHWAGM